MRPRATTTAAAGLSRRWVGRVALGAAAIVVVAWLLAPGLRAFLQSAVVATPDRQVAAWLHASTSASLTAWLRWLSAVQGTAGMLVMTLVAAAVLWRYGQRQAVPILLACVPGGMLLNAAVKHAVQRSRPDWGYALQVIPSFSFPSGHVAGTTLFYGAVVVWLWPRLRSAGARVALPVAAAALVLLIAVSRIVLGVHYLSDCIAAVCEGLLWLAICWAGTGAAARAPALAGHAP